MFLDVEAEVDEDDEDEEDYDDLEEDDFIAGQEDDEDLPDIYSRPSKPLPRDEDFDPEAEEARLKRLYGQASYRESDAEEMPQQFLLPSVSSPKLWAVKCRIGKERDIVFNLMRKYLMNEYNENPLVIQSAIYRENLKGYVYIESFKQAHVQHALDKVTGVYASKITLVPIKEMVDVMNISKKESNLKVGSWVRVKRGKYQNDLAQVVDLIDSNEIVRIKIVPRIDFNATKSSEQQLTAKEKRKLALVNRPAQKMFNPQEISQIDRSIRKSRGYWLFRGDTFLNGYLEKDVRISSLECENINPSLEEVTQFTGGVEPENLKDNPVPGIEAGNNVKFMEGDTVEVIEGDLSSLRGVVESVRDDSVTVKPKNSDIKETLVFSSSQLRKYFEAGDHVKVINGKYEGETGMVVGVSDNIVTLFSDLTMKELQVFARDLRDASEVTTVSNYIGNFDFHDLVQIDANNAGVIIKIDKDCAKLIDQNGLLRSLKVNEISKKKDSKNSVALDAFGNQVRMNDLVEILDGSHQGKQGNVLHIFRNHVFIKCTGHVENTGILVSRDNNVSLVGGHLKSQMSQPARVAGIPQVRGQAAVKTAAFRGRIVSVAAGPYKGYIGIIKEVNGNLAQVELHTNGKLISVDVTKIHFKDGNRNEPLRIVSRTEGSATPGYDGSRTPGWQTGARTPAVGFGMDGSRTPGYFSGARTPARNDGSRTPGNFGRNWEDGRTPAFDASQTPGMGGARTPAWNAPNSNSWSSGSKTPVWSGSGSKTPAWESGSKTPAWSSGRTPGSSGNKTPAWESGSKTPAWTSGAKTPAWESGSKTPAWSSGSKTPAWESGSKTPAYSSASITPNPILSSISSNSSQTPKLWSQESSKAIEDPRNLSQVPTNQVELKFYPRVEIKMRANYQQGRFTDALGVIKSATADLCQIELSDSKVINVPPIAFEIVKPEKKDKVIVLGGQHAGFSGVLVNSHDNDAVLLLDGASNSADNITMVPLAFVAKLKQ